MLYGSTRRWSDSGVGTIKKCQCLRTNIVPYLRHILRDVTPSPSPSWRVVDKEHHRCRSSVGGLVPEDAVQWILLGGMVVSCAASASVTVMDTPARNIYIERMNDEDEGFETAVRWSVMTVLSCLPFVNFMAWVFAALDNDDDGGEEGLSACNYNWVWAGLYLLPYVYSSNSSETGLFFPMDGFRWLCVGLGVLHVQLERMRYYNGGEFVSKFKIFDGVFLDEKIDEQDDLAREIQRDLEELEDFDTRLRNVQEKKQK